MVAVDIPSFHWADYVVLTVFLCFSAGVGVFHGFRSKGKQTTKEFLKGGGEMHFIPVALSMMAAFLSAIFVLGTPGEMYAYGTMYSYLGVAYFIGYPIAAHFYLPVFHKLKLTNAYEYLERRFNRHVRLAGSFTFCVMTIFYMSVVLYAPALALSQVTQLSMGLSIFAVGAVCTFYTALGGMKATVWNDAFQMSVILISTVVLIILGTLEVGDLNKVMDIASEGGRIQFAVFDLDPTIRHSFWSQIIGGSSFCLVLYGSSQSVIQKFLSVKTVRDGQKAVYAAAFSTFFCMVINVILGLVMYAYWVNCDPLTTGKVQSTDQLLPLFVMEVIGHLHGLPGLFLATVFGAALSTVSGGLNALAAVILEDFLKPLYKSRYGNEVSESTATIISRGIATFFGIFTIGMGFAAQFFGTTVLQIAISILGMMGGPLAGLLTNGILLPWVNVWGAMSGLVVSLGVTMWIGIGAVVFEVTPTLLDLSTDGCLVDNTNLTTTWSDVTPYIATTSDPGDGDDILDIYRVSYMYYSFIAIVLSVVVALPVSFITGYQKPSELDSELIYPVGSGCCCCCPSRCVQTCNCGVIHDDDDDDEDWEKEEKLDTVRTHIEENGIHLTNTMNGGVANQAYEGTKF